MPGLRFCIGTLDFEIERSRSPFRSDHIGYSTASLGAGQVRYFPALLGRRQVG
jgi:hypothetical protein